MDIYGVPEKKRFYKFLLTGSARAFMNEAAALNWPRLRAELISVFDFKLAAFDVFKQLEARKKLPGESALQYFLAMCGIGRQVDLAQEDTVRFIVEGLGDQSGKSSAMAYCTSLQELRQKIMIYDKLMKMPAQEQTKLGKLQVRASVPEGIRFYNCRQLEHMARECGRPKRPDGACFKCFGLDHTYQQCPKREASKRTALMEHEEESGPEDLTAVQPIEILRIAHGKFVFFRQISILP
ncbi:uncharacterized protein LOC127010856 isoform X2 [Drosophila biarmipes]|uniref:uncharacterized protein LOC127010856 isoform X1 n=1 Tax=Drosophila biarmipes TaxID=125945 RepID=UPI0021CC7E6C|nr:uncharacterized protein LOC127010856 isoform X1 [Drosophila biarmipes]XP_050742143.1 uncharacterized protein LOC127010856 isoform X2 [Drosophila biarmipes]